MALYPARDGTDASVRIYNNDGSEAGACGNGMRCVAALVSAETGKARLDFETPAGLVSCWRADADRFTVDMGAPRFRWDEIPLSQPMPDTRAIALEFSPPGGPACVRPRSSTWAIRTRSSGSRIRRSSILRGSARSSSTIRCFPSAPTSRSRPSPSRDHVVIRTWERGAGLT